MAERKGCQTPSSSVYARGRGKGSDYKEAVELYNNTGKTALKWQRDLLKHILAKNSKGLWIHTKFGYSVSRRNGKSEILIMRVLYGLEHGEQILYTAHRTTTSHSFFERVQRALDANGYIKASEVRKGDSTPREKLYDSYKANGLEAIVLRKSGARINFRTRTSKGGLGEGYDLLIIDEAQEYTDDQESALKYVVTDSKNPQTIMTGTPPTTTSAGTVFVKYRESCLEKKQKNSGWVEWGVDRMTDPHDKEAVYRTNPSIGYVFTMRSVEDEIGTDEVDFNIQRLGLWIKYNQKSAISEELWMSLKRNDRPELVGHLHVGIKFDVKGKSIALSVAAKTADDKIFVETLFCRPVSSGIDWIIKFLQCADYAEAVSDGKSGEQLMKDAAKQYKLKHIKYPDVTEVINANAEFEQALYSGRICHAGQPMLKEIVSNCQKRNIGSKGGFGYEALLEELDIAVMDSMIYAYWSCAKFKPHKQKVTAY